MSPSSWRDHVTTEAGTGAVHTAPGHGEDDFRVGQVYGLPVTNPVGGDGRYLEDTELFAGLWVWNANENIIQVLHTNGTLLFNEAFEHWYPHCWRHKTPTAFRVTPQWFINMDKAGLRETRTQGNYECSLGSWLGRGTHQRHGPESPGLVYFPPAYLGSADHAVYQPVEPGAASTNHQPDAQVLRWSNRKVWIAGIGMTSDPPRPCGKYLGKESRIFSMSGSIPVFTSCRTG